MSEITLAGERAVMLAERALWLPQYHALLVTDLHWGKAAAFRAANVPVPTGTTANDLARLTHIIQHTAAARVIVLGDLLHAKHGRHENTMSAIADWRSAHSHIAMDLVRGNHDAHAGDPPTALAIQCHDELRLGPFVLLHEPTSRPETYVLAGHWHPHVSLAGKGRQHVRLPCFAFGASRGVLPAFSSFTGHGMYERDPDDDIYAIAGESIVPVPMRKTR